MKLRQTTVGWSFLVRMKDGTENWTPLRLLKESNLVDIAEYVLAWKINNEPEFSWWVPYTLRKQDVIVSSIDSRIKNRTHKYGIEILTSHKEAISLDTLNGNTLWCTHVNLIWVMWELHLKYWSLGIKLLRAGRKQVVILAMTLRFFYPKNQMGKGRPSNTQPQNIMLCWGCISWEHTNSTDLCCVSHNWC